ncbi:MAG TPA: ABC transporter substrate-binding protein, partial [Methylomirabilota bacterium]|nr:ABC transporter substrate-binding protein [Methylomirabilota bacterium]
LLHAVDREAIVQEAFVGRYATARGILPPGTLGFNPRLVGYPFDLAKARQLLARAGYPGGKGLPVLEIWAGARHPGILREHELIRRNFDAIGVQTSFQYQTDWPTFSRLLTERRMPMFLYAWYADVPDPDNFLFKLFHSQSTRNLMGYANARVDAVLVAARNEPDPARRVEIYRRAEQLVLDDAPVIPVWHYTYERLFQTYVRSVEVNGFGDPYIPFRKIWLDRRP